MQYDDTFDFENPQAQAAILSLSAQLRAANPPLIVGEPSNFAEQFRDWVRCLCVSIVFLTSTQMHDRGEPFPMNGPGGTQRLCEWVEEVAGPRSDLVFETAAVQPPVLETTSDRVSDSRKRASTRGCTASDLKLRAARIRVVSSQLTSSMPSFTALPVYYQWQEFLEKYNAETGEPSGARAEQISDKWVLVRNERVVSNVSFSQQLR